MPGGRITKRSVDALKPADRDVYLWDADLAGFAVKTTPSGHKTYLIQYRLGGRGGRTRRVTIGANGSPWTPDKARKEAARLLHEVGLGADPAGVKAKQRLDPTIAELADRYLAEHVQHHNKPSTASEVRRIVETKIKPRLGKVKIADLTRAQVKTWHSAMHETPYEANRALAYFSKMMSLAAHEWELRSDNPCQGIRRFPEKKRDRYFTDEQLKRIGLALAKAEKEDDGFPGCIQAVRLLALTGLRLGELLDLRWEDIDFDARAIHLRDAKSGARSVPLAGSALATLNAMRRDSGPVVEGPKPGEPLHKSTFRRFWDRLKVEAGVPDGRPHDFRHTAGTYAAQAGFNAFMVRDLLGHKTLVMTGRYVERVTDPVRAAADAVADRVTAAMDGKKVHREVVELKRRR